MTVSQDIVSAVKDKAEGLFAKGRYAEAVETYEKIRQYGEKDPRIYLRMGDIARKTNELSAVDYYKDAYRSFTKLGFIIKAVAVCKMILNIDPSQAEVQNHLAALCAKPEPPKKAVSSAPAAERKPVAVEKPGKEAAEPKVPRTPLFSDFTEEELLEVIKKVRSRVLSAGEFLFHEGDRGDSIFIVAEGCVDVIGRTKENEEIRLARLGDSAIFGEYGFFMNARRSGSVKACEPSTILELTKSDLDEIIDIHRRVEDVLFNFYKERVVDRLMAVSELFKFLSESDRREILSRLSVAKFAKGTAIVREGEKGDTMYLIKEGKVSIWVAGKGGEPRLVTRLSEGDFFGEIALATSRPRVATVTALTDLKLVAFSRPLIKDILGKYPAIRQTLERVIKERVVDTLKARQQQAEAMI